MAILIDEVSNRLQVILGYAQILHELDDDERQQAIQGIERESEQLRSTLRSLTGWTRDPDGLAPWQERPRS
jgi:signal transduction histidine kinase